MTSIHGASESTCLYMNVACTPPSTRSARGQQSLAISRTRSAL